jgi:hypothetical protein
VPKTAPGGQHTGPASPSTGEGEPPPIRKARTASFQERAVGAKARIIELRRQLDLEDGQNSAQHQETAPSHPRSGWNCLHRPGKS